MKAVYSALFAPKEKGGFYCRVPDLPGCITTGRDLGECLDLIEDAANLWLSGAEMDGLPIPAATSPDAVHPEQDEFCALIAVDTEQYRKEHDTRAVRKNVSLPAWMAHQADMRGLNCSQLLQDAIRRALS